ncbi:unnamed protein product, partial [Amoebophrya sp. A25]
TSGVPGQQLQGDAPSQPQAPLSPQFGGASAVAGRERVESFGDPNFVVEAIADKGVDLKELKMAEKTAADETHMPAQASTSPRSHISTTVKGQEQVVQETPRAIV